MKIDWFVVLRDVLMVTVLGALGTFGLSVFLIGRPQWTQYLVAFSMLSIGFAISASLKGAGRFKHLPIVALGAWIVVAIDRSLREPERLPGILVLGTVTILVAAVAGGLLSLLIRRSPTDSAPPSG